MHWSATSKSSKDAQARANTLSGTLCNFDTRAPRAPSFTGLLCWSKLSATARTEFSLIDLFSDLHLPKADFISGDALPETPSP